MNRINIGFIIKSHLNTLRRFDNEMYSIGDIIFFFILPAMASLILGWQGVDLDKQVPNLIAIISIFGGFLFNLLAIIYGYLKDIASEQGVSKIRLRFANEINSNIAFCILLSVFSVICLLIYGMLPTPTGKGFYSYFRYTFLGVNYFFLFCFVLTLMMVLSRVFVLLKRDDK